jgi:hypothetical protein
VLEKDAKVVSISLSKDYFFPETLRIVASGTLSHFSVKPVRHFASFAPSFFDRLETYVLEDGFEMIEGQITRVLYAR